MRRLILSRLLTVLFAMMSLVSAAQDFREAMQVLRNNCMKSTSLAVEMEIAVYDSAQKHPYYKEVAEVWRDGDNYWYRFGENEMLLNEECVMVINTQTKQISYRPRNVQTESEMRQSFEFDLDSILTRYEHFDYLGNVDGAEHYRVIEKEGPIEQIHFYILADKSQLREMAYNYRTGQYATIRFLKFALNTSFAQEAFSENKYIRRENKRILPNGLYTNYRIIYQ